MLRGVSRIFSSGADFIFRVGRAEIFSLRVLCAVHYTLGRYFYGAHVLKMVLSGTIKEDLKRKFVFSKMKFVKLYF